MRAAGIAFTLGILASALPAVAQDDVATYPNRQITLITVTAAGAALDVVARTIGNGLQEQMGQPVVVINRVGAGGNIGVGELARSKPDGYTIMMGHMGTHGAAPALYPNLKYDPTKDFEPIGMAAGTPILIVAKKDFPANNLKEMIAYLKANPDKVNQAHAGIGAVSHMTCILFNSQIGVKPAAVPYSGTGPALNDLVSGQVDYMCDQIVNLVSQVKAGSIKAFAIAMPERSPALPDVPTTKEAGMPDYEVTAWNAVFAPKDTPKEVVTALSSALDKALDDAGTKGRLLDLGGVLPTKAERGGDWLGAFVKKEVARWTPVLKDASK